MTQAPLHCHETHGVDDGGGEGVRMKRIDPLHHAPVSWRGDGRDIGSLCDLRRRL